MPITIKLKHENNQKQKKNQSRKTILEEKVK